MLSKQQALKETRDMWNTMGKLAEHGLIAKKSEVLDQKYVSSCPCCQYTTQTNSTNKVICKRCPITWPSDHCMNQGSPYLNWVILRQYHILGDYVSTMDMAFFCFLIADLASEALLKI